MLGSGGGVETNDEVVAAVVKGFQFPSGLREAEYSPVCYAADEAARGEDLGACCFGDSVDGGGDVVSGGWR